jgi:hypothetical protein
MHDVKEQFARKQASAAAVQGFVPFISSDEMRT